MRPARTRLSLALILAATAALSSHCSAAWQVGTPIVTYWGPPHLTTAIAQQAVAGGFNLVGASSVAELNIAQSYGLRAMYTGPLDTQTIQQIRNNPALYSYFYIDEPSASSFSALASTVQQVRTLDPQHMLYIDLFPTYASNSQLGTSGDTVTAYNAYLNQYMSTVKPSLISYDHYQFFNGTDTDQYFLNLKMTHDAAVKANVPFMQVVQACAWESNWRIPNANELRFLNYTNLAYGAQGISYFTYSPQHPNTGGIAPANDGTPTSVYTALQTINPQFVAIASKLQPLHSIGAYHLGDQPPGTLLLPSNSPFTFSPGVPNTTYVDGTPVKGMLLGLFGPDGQLGNGQYALAVNLDYVNSKTTTLLGQGSLAIFDTTTGLWTPTGSNQASLTLPPGGGELVRLIGTEWKSNSSGDWGVPSHWSGGAANTVDMGAYFLGSITAPRTIATDVPVTVGTLKFDNPNRYLITGAGSLTIQTSTGSGSVSVVQGSHMLNLPVIFASNTTVTVANGATLAITDSATIKAGKTVTKSGNLLFQAPLTIEAGGALVVGSGAADVFGAPAIASGGMIDLTNNAMNVDYKQQPSPANAIKAQLAQGYARGAWNGAGVNTSSAIADHTGLGWNDNTDVQSLLVKYTFYGDTNLDGRVDLSDLENLAKSWKAGGTWIDGDSNYDNVVDLSDLQLLANNWQAGVVDPLGTDSLEAALSSLGLPDVAVPEPGMLGVVMLGALMLYRRWGRLGRSGLGHSASCGQL